MSTHELAELVTAPSGATATAGANAATILVIDDAASCRKMVAVALRGHGFNILAAGTGPAAIEILEHNTVNLIVLDYEMPGMDGLKFLRLMRGDPRWQTLPVIILTASTAKPAVMEAMRNGVCGYLLKSKCSLAELFDRVQQALGKEPAANALRADSDELIKRVRTAMGFAPSAGAAGVARPVTSSVVTAAAPPKTLPTSAPSAHHVTSLPQSQPKAGAITSPAEIIAPNLVPRDTTLKAVSDLSSARMLAGVATEVATICGAAKVSLNELAGTIKQDPILSARVLQFANSASSKTKAKTVTIEDAIRAAGPEVIANLTSSVGLLGSFEVGKADGLDLLCCWQHAVATATVMSRIVPQTDRIGAGLPHLVGLFCGLPEILLRQRFPTEYAAASHHAAKAALPTRDLTEPIFGISHKELTQHILAELKFPAEVADPINEFNRHVNATLDSCKGLMARSLAIAKSYVYGLMLGPQARERVSPVALTDCRTVLIKTEALNMAEIRSEAITGACMLAKLTPELETVALKPLLKSEARVWYARHSSFAPLDPLESGLSHLCNVATHDRMPTLGELSGVGGIVIAAPGNNNALVSEVTRLRPNRAAERPVLHLVAAGGPATQSRPGIEESTYPITLERLAKFISTLKVGD